jgi:hypothetical protein
LVGSWLIPATLSWFKLKKQIRKLNFYHERLKRLFKGDGTSEAVMEAIKDDIADAYAKGQISELQYKLLNEKILDIISNASKTRMNYDKVVRRSPI